MEYQERTWQLYLRFIEGDSLSPAESSELLDFFKAEPGMKDEYAIMRDIWNLSGITADEKKELVDQEWQRLKSRTGIREQYPRLASSEASSVFKKMLRIAAILIIGVGLGVSMLYIIDRSRPAAFTDQSIQVPFGSKVNLVLPDGTKVTLNAGSLLVYGSGFGKRTRDVRLVGEGYFDVAKNTKTPFRVKTAEVTVTAHGTVFNVKSYPEERVVETTLVEGSISVQLNSSPSNKIKLKPNEQVLLYKSESENNEQEKVLVTKGIDPLLYTSWTSDRLVIRSEPMERLAVSLERRYNVKIDFSDESIKNIRFTGTIENETIEQVFTAIKISSDIDFRVDGRNIHLFIHNFLNER
jgi:transmembrane sensor